MKFLLCLPFFIPKVTTVDILCVYVMYVHTYTFKIIYVYIKYIKRIVF